MQIINLGEKLNCRVVVCLGFFGCMHKGHMELLYQAKLRARQTDSKVALFTFSNNHLAVLNRDSTVVYTYGERLSVYNSVGVDIVIAAHFDDSFKALTGRQFLSQFLQYDLQGVVCGFDHSCGSDRLDCLGVQQFFADVCSVDIVQQIAVDGQKVSTTLIRNLLASSQLDKANALLSEQFFAIGEVIHGRGVGKTLGFPTANISLPSEKLLPIGVYGGVTDVDGITYRAIANIGHTPTFDIKRNAFEVHIIDFNGNLYGKTLKISLTKYLRPITKFGSASALAEQLQHDKENVLND